jgi:FkbM family methyltransferase
MNRRIGLLMQTAARRRAGGPPAQWLRNVFAPTSGPLAMRLIEKTEEDDRFIRVKLKGHDGWLFYPRQLDVAALHQTLSEQGYPWHWHYYAIPQTAVTSRDVVFDCGSAEGIFAFLNRARARHVFAFEPLPDYADSLNATFRDDPRVTVVPCALGAAEGTAYLHRSGFASTVTDQPTDTPLRVDTIDAFCRRAGTRVDYIKADVEGYELQILRGAADAIREFRPRIAVTTYHNRDDARDIAAFLRGVVPEYSILCKGIEHFYGAPVMLHAWIDR